MLASVLAWNAGPSIGPCLESLLAQSHPCHVLVIDNGSTDGTADYIAEHFPTVELIRLPHNTGFCGGHNHAIRAAEKRGHTHVWLVNDDARVERTALARMLQDMESDPAIGLCSPVIMNDGDQHDAVEFCGARFDMDNFRKVKLPSLEAARLAAAAGEINMLHGTAILARMDLITRIGGLDERYFAYFDDDSLSMRSLQAGMKNHMSLDAIVWHDNPVAHERSAYYHYLMTRNAWIFWSGQTGLRGKWRLLRTLGAKALVDAASLLQKGRTAQSTALLRGLYDGLVKRYGPPPQNPSIGRMWFRVLMWHPYFLARVLAPAPRPASSHPPAMTA
ncbi:glycosyltransferase family 2 protein [Uliginosibacterium sp. H1]|uniref:glycosyltransferase family 2 protein n=1 Tax=Uliginosibacterium sp. H1 TaxID=3114757 RepID=UPI002E1801BD|nr:glycosyltransferase family 2 protein [Uliginosibacterium sp. H1]